MMASPHLLIVGASARSAAFSALRAGLQPWCADLFADLDLQRRCAVTRRTDRYPEGFRQFIESERPGPWMYTGGLENWPQLVEQFAQRRPLWGNGAKALSLARNPEHLTALLQRAGMPVPELVSIHEGLAREERWLIKPRKSAGGAGIRFGTKLTGGLDKSTTYCQEFIDGDSTVLLFLGDGRQSCLLGLTRQLVGIPWLHAAPFRYCGSIGPLDGSIVQRPALEKLGHLLASECSLEGLFGVDGVLRDGIFWPVEINPRYTASVEVLEYATGWPILAWHGHVFTQGQLPPVPPPMALVERCIGKAILFARDDLHFPADGPWMAELHSSTPVQDLPAFADIPEAGQPIPAGRPILTLFVDAASVAACEEALRHKAADLDRWLFNRRPRSP